MFRKVIQTLAIVITAGLLVSACNKPCNCCERTKQEERKAEATTKDNPAVFGKPVMIDRRYILDVAVLDIFAPGGQPGAVMQFRDQYVTVTGTITQVCTQKGCWVRLAGYRTDGIFVSLDVPANGTLIPPNAVGKNAVVHGTFRMPVLSEEEARQHAVETGCSPEEIASIKGSRNLLRIDALGIEIAGL